MKQLLAVAVVLSGCGFTPAAAEAVQGTLYKQQQCECCEAHADYLRKNGFEIKIEAVRNLSQISLDAGVPQGFQGCHLIKINGYVFEGHVTSDIIKKVLHDKPDLVGVSIKGMPAGVPGMDGPKKGPIDVHGIKKDGSTFVYATQ